MGNGVWGILMEGGDEKVLAYIIKHPLLKKKKKKNETEPSIQKKFEGTMMRAEPVR